MTTPVPESIYYARHLKLPGFGAETQSRLKHARVVIVGVGGLGCPVALYLAGAGVGCIVLCDADTVSATNLHRQVLFDTSSLGEKKVHAAARRLRSINPNIEVVPVDLSAEGELLEGLIAGASVVIDGTDNFAAKYAINDACQKARIPLVYGSIFQYEGQVSVFHAPTSDWPEGISYRDVYPQAPPSGLSQNCGEAGVVGVLPGIIGTLQAAEAIKIITGLGETLSGSMLVFDLLTSNSRKLKLKRRSRPANQVTEPALMGSCPSDEIDLEQLKSLVIADPSGEGAGACLVDVREPSEVAACGSIGGLNLPLSSLASNLSLLPIGGSLVLYCKSGVRSAKATLYLRSVFPGRTVLSLRGGMDGATCAVALNESGLHLLAGA